MLMKVVVLLSGRLFLFLVVPESALPPEAFVRWVNAVVDRYACPKEA